MYYIRSKSLDVLAANTTPKNTKFVRRKYHYTADILFYCFGIYRTSKSVDNFNIHKKVAEYKRYNLASFIVSTAVNTTTIRECKGIK